jgi:hypothetical protein
VAEDHATWFKRWAEEMRSDSAPGGKIPSGPIETQTTKAGFKTPTRNKKAGRIPPVTEAGARKGGPPS